jgi:Holliday junction resolvase
MDVAIGAVTGSAVSQQKAKGTAAERATVEWLRQHGWLEAERRALSGSADRGDVAGVHPDWVGEVKNHRSHDLGGWIKELAAEKRNAGAAHGALIVKKRGTTNPGDWYVVTTLEDYARLMTRAGMGGGPHS